MQLESWRKRLLVLAGFLLVASTFTACTWSVGGGVVGSLLSLIAVLALVAGAGVTQQGCSTGACLSMGPGPSPDGGPDVGPCLSDAGSNGDTSNDEVHVGPCLSLPEPDAVQDVGPCLKDIGPDDDTDFGPCLTFEPDTPEDDTPDTSPDAEPDEPDGSGDVGPCLTDTGPGDVGPCLSQPPQDTSAWTPQRPGPATAPEHSRAAVQRRLAALGVLPADVADRLAGKKS